MKAVKVFLFIVMISGFAVGRTAAEEPIHEIFVDFKGQAQRVTYSLYVPENQTKKLLPVVVCVGGLPMIDGKYVQSDPQECTDQNWKRFANEKGAAILGLGFLFVEKDWPNNESYQFPRAWSGRALLEILQILSEDNPINPKEIYLYGVSAGAQFATRFAQLHPDISTAVASHAAGGYDPPASYLKTKFLITVGELDNDPYTRVEFAKLFVQEAERAGIDVELFIVPGIGHRQTEQQNEMSRQFFENVLKDRNH